MAEQGKIATFSECYQKFCVNTPLVSQGVIVDSQSIEITQSQGALSEEKTVSFTRNFKLENDGKSYSQVGFPILHSEQIKARIYSPSRKYVAIILKKDESDIIEIWDKQRIIKIIHCKNCGKDDKAETICTDEFFGGIQWTKDENYILFTTIRDNKIDSEPFYNQHLNQKGKKYGTQFEYEETWGNSMEDISYTSLWVANIFGDNCDNNKIQVRKISSIPDEIIVAQAVWTPNCSGIVFVGKKRYHRRLGQIYCINRPAGIFKIDINLNNLFSSEKIKFDEKVVLLTENCEEDFAAAFPSFSPDGEYLIYHTTSSAYAHASCCRLRGIKWNKQTDSNDGKRKKIYFTHSKYLDIYLKKSRYFMKIINYILESIMHF